jgi:hypothetical protein
MPSRGTQPEWKDKVVHLTPREFVRSVTDPDHPEGHPPGPGTPRPRPPPPEGSMASY